MTQLAQQLGGRNNNNTTAGPITGGGYVNWNEQLRDVEQVVDSQDLRNQLATVRERTQVLRQDYRDNGDRQYYRRERNN